MLVSSPRSRKPRNRGIGLATIAIILTAAWSVEAIGRTYKSSNGADICALDCNVEIKGVSSERRVGVAAADWHPINLQPKVEGIWVNTGVSVEYERTIIGACIPIDRIRIIIGDHYKWVAIARRGIVKGHRAIAAICAVRTYWKLIEIIVPDIGLSGGYGGHAAQHGDQRYVKKNFFHVLPICLVLVQSVDF